MTKDQIELLKLEAATPVGKNWYLALSKPNREAYAVKNLETQSFEVFLPQIVKRRRVGKRLEDRRAPLFPRYLFVRLDLWRDRWRSVLSTFGVSTIVMQNSRPLPAPSSVVDQLLLARDANGCIDFEDKFLEGDLVRFKTGPFSELVGRLACLTESDRVAVLLEIMGAKRHVTAKRGDLLPVHSIRNSALDDPVQSR